MKACVCKRAGMLIGWDEASRRAYFATGQCDSWHCPECAERMHEAWRMRAGLGAARMLAKGEACDFVTITCHENLHTWEATERVWRSAWPRLYAALKRQHRDLMYMLIPERHQDGRMHVHGIWNAGVSQRWLKNAARERGLGHQCKVIEMAERGWAERYITKYIAKSVDADYPEHFRRVRASQNWPKLPKPETGLTLRWEYTTHEEVVFQWLRQCAEQHYTCIDQHTGEIFDYDPAAWLGGVTQTG